MLQGNLKGEPENENIAEIEVFFDEIEPEKGCNYLILGASFIHSKDKKKIINKLLDSRCLNPKNGKWSTRYCDCRDKKNCRAIWHDLNNTEIHFSEIKEGKTNMSRTEIPKKWLNIFINENIIYSAILYIDLDKLDTSFFGNQDIHANIYNKFFRTIINYGLRCFFNTYDKIKIKNIFYDKKEDLEKHAFFNNFNLDQIKYESKENIEFCGKVIFIDSNHRLEKEYKDESNLIQLTDLLLGVVRQNIFYPSKDKLKNKIARIIRPKLNELKIKYWSLNYFKISFFPKNEIKSVRDLQENKTYERNDEFYSLKDIKLQMPAQETNLNDWF